MGYDGFNYSIENIESKNIEVVLEAGTFSNVLFKLAKKRFPHIKHNRRIRKSILLLF